MLWLTAGTPAVGREVVPAHTPATARRLQPLDRYPGTNRLNLAIGLPLRNQNELAGLLRQIYNPASPNYRHYLTPQQFTERFGPTEEDYQAVVAFAKTNHLKVTATHANRMLVDVNASVSDIEQALHVKMHVFQHPTEKRLFHAPDTSPSLDLNVPVLGISGLDNYSLPRPHLQATPLVASRNVSLMTGSGPGGNYMGKDFRAAYVPDTAMDGSGQAVGLLQFDGYAASDITYYENLAGLPSVTLSNVLVDGASGNPSGGGNEVEVCLDIEMAISMAPNLSQVVVYMAPNGSPWEDILNRMATDDVAQQLSCSWYLRDGGSNAVTDQIFQQMAAQGQSFFVASGDYDAFTGLIPFPCDSPYVTQVGGTTLTTSGPQGFWISETVWNWNDGIGSSGGISTQYPIPSWQTNINMRANQGSTTMRNVPDVALTANQVYLRVDGTDDTAAGTSCAAPLWAGLTALANQEAAARSRPPLGLVNSAVDAIGTGDNYSGAFHDITNGNNTSASSPSKFYAVAGYDLCTGWGTPAGQRLIDALAVPEILAIMPAPGFNSVGPVSGPFSVTSQSFSLANVGTNSLNWTVASPSPWLTVSPSGGTLDPDGSETNVTVSLNSAATNLPIGTYSATVWFTNLNSAIAQSRQFNLTIFDPLQIAPAAGFSTIGGVGGPFSITSQQFSLTNLGAARLIWSLGNNSTWLNASPSSGILTNGGPAAAITVSLNSSAYTNVDGIYTASISFADQNNTVGQSRQFVLNVGQIPVITAEPTNETVMVGGTATFSLGVASIGPCAFQWQLDGTNLPDNIITTLAGDGTFGYSGDNGAATNATLDEPYGVALDGAGNLFIADTDNNCIRKVDPYGIITTVAGNGNPGYSGDGGAATNAALDEPYGVAMDKAGNLYIADTDNNCIRKVDATGTITTVAGNGEAGFSGDGGTATNASLNAPSCLALDDVGNLFVTDVFNNRIRKVGTNGIITTVAGNGSAGYFGDGGTATNASLSYPLGLAVDGAGNLFIADLGNNRIRQVNARGIISTVAGNGSAGYAGDGGPAANASLSYPSGVAVAGSDLFIADTYNNRIRKVDANGIVTTVVGNGVAGFAGDGGQATNASLSYPFDVEVDAANNLYVADLGNNRIRKIESSDPPTLTLYNVNANEAGNYSAIITNAWGSVTSSVVTLTVVAPPIIVQQPLSQDVAAGGTAILSVAVSGTTPLGCQWQKDGLDLIDGGTISGSETTNLVLSSTTTNENGSYTIIITNAWGSVTSSAARLTVVFPPVITSQPQSLIVTNGNPAGFSISVVGAAPLECQWQKNGLNLIDGGNLSGSETTNLVLSATTTNDAGNYTIVIANAWGSVTSSVANLTVVSPPMITGQPQSLTIANGSPTGFGVAASGSPPLGYQWQKNGLDLTDGGNLSGSETTNLVLDSTSTNDAGNYTVIVTNAWGCVTSGIASLTVVFPPVITSQPQSLVVSNGSPAGFSVAVSGTAPLGYQWQKNGVALTDGGTLSGSAATNLSLSLATITDAGNYTVLVTNAWGCVTSSIASLTVISPPVITGQPQGLTVINLGPASFRVMVAGTPPLSYQWQENGLDLTDGDTLSGSETTNLVLSSSTTNEAGNYTVIISNAWGSVTSSIASLAIVFPPVITSQPQGLNVTNGSATRFSVSVSGTPPLAYQWQKNGLDLTDGGTLTGSETTNLALSFATLNDAGNYAIIVTNAWGCVTSSIANLTVVSPPIITTQPQGLAITNGSPASFSVTVAGTPPLTYQWQENGLNLTNDGNLSGSESTNLVVSSATTNDAGNYTVIITNAWGSVTSSVASLAIVNPPAILSQPQGLTVTNGSPAAFSVTVSGTPPLAYQWQKNGLDLADSGTFSGSESTNLSLSLATMNEAGNYTVIITNAWGSVTSSVAALTVVYPPTIASQPQGLTVTNGSRASFIVLAAGTPPLSYRWQENGLDLTDGGTLSGAETTNLVLSSATTNDAGDYTVIITNGWGGVTSSIASLAIAFPPVIISQPQSLTLTNGSPADFTVAASGTPPLGYQWQKNGLDLADSGTLSGSEATNLVLSFTTTNDAGNYTIIITNAWGGVTSSVANLTLVSPPEIIRQPQGLTVTNGGPASLSVMVAGTPPLNYQWLKNGMALTDSGPLSGSETTNLMVFSTTTNDAGNYVVIITNAWGCVTSSVATLTIASPPTIVSQPQGITVTNGSPAGFSVTVSGVPPFGYQWQMNGLDLTNDDNLSGADTTNLLLSFTTTNDAGNYTIIITNAWGSVTSSIAALTVAFPPTITSQPQDLTVTNGSPAVFNVTVAGTSPLGYQWQKNGLDLTDGGDLSGSETTNLVLSSTAVSDAGTYSVIITNAWGSVTSSVATLIVAWPPVITGAPSSLAVTNGSAASFRVAASGAAPLGYQWQKDGVNLADGGNLLGSESAVLNLSPVTTNDAGSYTVIITNAWGSITSTVAALTVVFPPAITSQPQSLTEPNGNSADFSVSATGTPPLSYQWQKNGLDLNEPNQTDIGILFSPGTTNLLLNSITAYDAGNYTVIITNAWGSVTSSVATLTVLAPPVIIGQPQSVALTNLSPARFSVTALGAPPFGCQWQKDGVNLVDGDTLMGSETTNLFLSSITTNDAGNYTIIITDAWGSVTSSVATLAVVFPPAISGQPQSLTVTNGGLAGFSVVVSGTPPLGFQWQKDETDLLDTNLASSSTLSGADTTNLVLSLATINDAGNYIVIITNAWGSITSSVAILTVVSPPMIISQPQGLTVPGGSPADFNVSVSGTAPLGCQWQKNGVNLTDGANLSGADTTNLVLSLATINDAGNYTVIVSNAWGSLTSSVATLTVILPPVINIQPQGLTVTSGNPASFTVTAAGTPPLSYQWQKNGANLTDYGHLSGSTTPGLRLSATTTNDAGNYSVIIANASGSVTSSLALLVVMSPPVIVQQPSNQILVAGSTASFSVMAGGTPPARFQWLFNGTNISGATNLSLILSNVQPALAGNYAVSATNIYGSALSSNAVLAITPDHFSWSQIPSPRFANTPFSVTIQAWETSNAMFTNFTGTALLDSTNGLTVSPALTGKFVQGAWTGTVAVGQTMTNLVLRAGDGLGHVGLANAITVVTVPPLSARISGNTLTFLWPSSYTGFVLQASVSLSPPAWAPVSVSPIRLGNQYFVPLTISGTNCYYRLRFPGP